MGLFQILSAILHLGNVEVKERGSSSCCTSVSHVEYARINGLFNKHLAFSHIDSTLCCPRCVQDESGHLAVFCDLTEVSYESMSHWLCHKKLKTATETLNKHVTQLEAINGRDALAKHIYAKLFSWIVGQVNKSLSTSSKPHSFIGVLDIYGWVRCYYFIFILYWC